MKDNEVFLTASTVGGGGGSEEGGEGGGGGCWELFLWGVEERWSCFVFCYKELGQLFDLEELFIFFQTCRLRS